MGFFRDRRGLWTALGGGICFLLAFGLVWGFAGRFRSGENLHEAGDIHRVGRGTPTPAPILPPPPEVRATVPSSAPEWVVYVTGEVRRPGIVRLPPDSRVYQAVDRAGGFTAAADPEGVNLAAPLRDGDHVRVPPRGAPPRASSSPPSPGTPIPLKPRPSGGETLRVDPNRASVAELEALPGVGPKTAAAIVAAREAQGPFRAPEDLLRVKGIGPKKLEQMRPFLDLAP